MSHDSRYHKEFEQEKREFRRKNERGDERQKPESYSERYLLAGALYILASPENLQLMSFANWTRLYLSFVNACKTWTRSSLSALHLTRPVGKGSREEIDTINQVDMIEIPDMTETKDMTEILDMIDGIYFSNRSNGPRTDMKETTDTTAEMTEGDIIIIIVQEGPVRPKGLTSLEE